MKKCQRRQEKKRKTGGIEGFPCGEGKFRGKAVNIMDIKALQYNCHLPLSHQFR